MKIVGIGEVNYVSGKTGRPVHGFEFYGTYPAKKCILGEATVKEYISAAVMESQGGVLPELGDEVEFTYNRYGNIVGFQIVGCVD